MSGQNGITPEFINIKVQYSKNKNTLNMNYF